MTGELHLEQVGLYDGVGVGNGHRFNGGVAVPYQMDMDVSSSALV